MKNNIDFYEIVGVWGSGKTTLINSVSDKLISNGLQVKTFLDFDKQPTLKRYSTISLFILKNPLYFIKLLCYLIKIFYKLTPLDNLQKDIFKTLIKRILIKNTFKNIKTGIFLSEGIIHLLTMFDKMNKLSLKEILFCIDRNFLLHVNYIVHIKINRDLAIKNVIKDNKKKYFRFSKNDFNNLKNLLIRLIKNENLIIKKLKLNKKNILKLSNKSTLSNNKKYLYNFIIEKRN